jgi:hypothetical protein
VLVDVVKSVQNPEIVPLPSLVWFNRVDRVNGILPHTLYFSRSRGFVFRGLTGNRKASFVAESMGTFGADKVELLGKMVEGGSEILDRIPENRGDYSGIGLTSAT